MNSFSPAMVPTNENSTYSVSGADCQVLTVALKHKEEISTEAGMSINSLFTFVVVKYI